MPESLQRSTNSDDDIEGNDKFWKKIKRNLLCLFQLSCIMLMDQTSHSEIVNIAPGEGQIPVSFILEPNWEALAFPKDYTTEKNHYNEEGEIPITPSKYVHARLKC